MNKEINNLKLFLEKNYLPIETSVSVQEPTVVYADGIGHVILGELEATFAEEVISLAKKKYNDNLGKFAARAMLSRQIVSKMNLDASYLPTKRNAFACVLALELDETAARSLLQKVSYTFSRSNLLDLTILYCVQHKIYDISLINELLFEIDQPLLGSI